MQGFRATACTNAHTLLSGVYTRGVVVPDAEGNFKGLSVPAEAWERIFRRTWENVHTCHAECPCHEGGEPVPDFEEPDEAR